MESVPSSPGEGEGVWRVYHHHLVSVESVPSSPGEGEGVYHHLVRGGSVVSVPPSPGEREEVLRVYHHHLVRGKECGECTIITW